MKIEEFSNQNAYFYRGTSMACTFKNGDFLFFKKITTSELVCGDIIVFNFKNPKETNNHCVHRIIARSNLVSITRGDNNSGNDTEPVTEENLIGKVTHYERNGNLRKVWNGRLGKMQARVLHGRLYFLTVMKSLLRKPYHLLKKSGIITRIWQPETKTIYFKTKDGPLIKYTHKGRTVALYWTKTNFWQIRRPYDFVIGPKPKK